MSKGIITIPFADGCSGVAAQLDSLGMLTSIVGTPTTTVAIFNGPFCDADTYIRLRANSVNTTTNNSINIEVGTVSGTTFTPTRVPKTLSTTADYARTSWSIVYDTVENIIIIIAYGATANVGEFAYIGKLDTGDNICFMGSSGEVTNGVFPTDSADTTTSYKLLTLKNTLSNGTAYYETKIHLTNANGSLVMNGTSPAYVFGITSVGVILSVTILINAAWVLFGAQYVSGASGADNNLYTQLKINLA